jgi:molecular chaperone DnaK
LEEKGDKIDAKQKEETIKLKEELEKAIKENDFEKLKSKLADLEKAAEFMSRNQGAQENNPDSSGNENDQNKKDDDVIDADFTEKKK